MFWSLPKNIDLEDLRREVSEAHPEAVTIAVEWKGEAVVMWTERGLARALRVGVAVEVPGPAWIIWQRRPARTAAEVARQLAAEVRRREAIEAHRGGDEEITINVYDGTPEEMEA